MSTLQIVQAGGVLAFAGLVLELLRRLLPVLKDLRLELAGLRGEVFEMRITFAALLERERIRDAKRRREDSQPPTPGAKQRKPDPFSAEETTDIHELIEAERAKAERAKAGASGIRKPRPGTHHDKER